MSKPAEIKEPAKFKFLKKTVKTSEPVNNRLVNIINTLWQQKVPLYKLKYEIAKLTLQEIVTSLPPNYAIKNCGITPFTRGIEISKECKKLLSKEALR